MGFLVLLAVTTAAFFGGEPWLILLGGTGLHLESVGKYWSLVLRARTAEARGVMMRGWAVSFGQCLLFSSLAFALGYALSLLA
ncbi:MAG: hypothetical protein K2Y42_10110 [Hyphomicrobium sp.]|jgi:hypothetical protein|uniref:hypothetical protein n=1 Tax=Hyphomicrobium sp. TaxID=82 RepID=UPI0025BA9E29|nr:hypothetical protein [Hyphomicrobium sp.]MBX9863092.1 hypothetical protein [Hyphomicrobium sp.]